MTTFNYTDKQTEYLSQRDPKLGEAIVRIGKVQRSVFEDFFSGICFNIVNQQLSMKACETLWQKLTDKVKITPEGCRDSEDLRACGLSSAKANCIAALSEKILSGEINPEYFPRMTDEEIISVLTSVKGIGRWTAEMTLIFCLQRPDVLSLSDYGIRRGLSNLHGMDIKDIKAMERFRELYSPYGTVASIYLWEC